MESDMRRRDKLKQTGVLKTNGSLMNKIFKVYMLLLNDEVKQSLMAAPFWKYFALYSRL